MPEPAPDVVPLAMVPPTPPATPFLLSEEPVDAMPPPLPPDSPIDPTPSSVLAPRVPDFEYLKLFRDQYKEI